jgi:lantibiotic modifying enzyme
MQAYSTSTILSNINDYMMRQANFDRSDRVWPSHWFGFNSDPACIQFGSSGVGLYLLQALDFTNETNVQLINHVVDWTIERISHDPIRSQGLYFGRAGVAWFLGEATRVLKRRDTETVLEQIASELPEQTLIPDIMHGSAGIGLTYLYLWHLFGADIFLARAISVGRNLVGGKKMHNQNPVWPIPDGVDFQGFSGQTFYGFAHGNAGIATFFLYLYAATKDDFWLQQSVDAASTLLEVVQYEIGHAFWAFGPENPMLWPHWCNGSSGVGTCLIRLYFVTRDDRYLELADKAACTVMRFKWESSVTQCHGLSGDGDFLMDMYKFTGNRSYKQMAKEVIDVIYMNRIYRDDAVVFAGEANMRIQCDYGTGMAGIGAFLSRYVEEKDRQLMLDILLWDLSK